MLLLLPNTPKTQYYHNQGKIFGTYYNIRYEATEDYHDNVKAALKAVDQSLSMFNPNSVISKINRNDSVILDSLFITMFNEALAPLSSTSPATRSFRAILPLRLQPLPKDK